MMEGVGDHGCEYMTAGTVVILGDVGRNFAAGMTGGEAFVLDAKGNFLRNCNHELVGLEQVCARDDAQTLRALIERHYELTGSPRAREVLSYWSECLPRFWRVITEGARLAVELSNPQTGGRADALVQEAAPQDLIVVSASN
jgi:glutamate synthase domain-containing protein 3